MLCGDDGSEEWTPDSITKFGRVVKIRFIHDDESSIMYLDFFIFCSNSSWEVTPSILEPSYVVMSLLCQTCFRMRNTKKDRKWLFTKAESKFNWKLFVNHSKSSCHWLGERYSVFSFKFNALLQVMAIFNFKWKRNVAANTKHLLI